MARRSLSLGLALVLSLTICAASPAAAEPADGLDPIRVDRLTFHVTLSDGNPYDIVGYYYHHSGSHAHPLQVLVHGVGYDHRYWDAGVIDGVDYSYARHMAGEGYEVLAIDQLGAGESSRPPGYFLDLSETASGVGQVLAGLRAANNPTGKRFRQIVLVGHSNGSITSIREESRFHQADALVTTGWEHTVVSIPIDPSFLLPLLGSPYLPANAFPEPVRAFLFYYSPSADPAVITYDASNLASTAATGQFLDVLRLDSAPTLDGVAGVTGPVLVQLGDHDLIAPATNAPSEPGYWSCASSVTVQVLPAMGHVVNLHLNHVESWTGIDAWIRRTLGDGDDG